MTHRNWKSYQDALTAYNAAKARHEAAVQEWNAKLSRFDKDSDQAEAVNGGGCLVVIVAGIIAVANGVADRHWGWIIVYFMVFGLYQSLDQKCRTYQKRRYLATVPTPRFAFDEPTYEPPPENYQPPPRAEPPPPPPQTETTLTLDAALSILGLTRRTTPEELKQAYRDRIREYHPDKVAHLGSELRQLAERKAKEINAAYEYVSKAFQGRSRP
jgi:DnaJ-domain-containing protein 1